MTRTRPRIQVDDYATGISTIYTDWNEYREERRAQEPVELIPAHPTPCAMCWGQRQIFHASPNGEGLVPHLCHWCHGYGIRLNRGHGPR